MTSLLLIIQFVLSKGLVWEEFDEEFKEAIVDG